MMAADVCGDIFTCDKENSPRTNVEGACRMGQTAHA